MLSPKNEQLIKTSLTKVLSISSNKTRMSNKSGLLLVVMIQTLT